MSDLDAFIAGLPKAELHLHIEGSLEPELMFELAARNGVAIPFASVEEVRAAYSFTRLQDFLDIYYQGAGVLITERDFHDLAMAYFDRVARDGVVHAELMFDPQTHTARGIAFDTVIRGLLSACAEAQATHGITSRLILCFLRHLDEADAFVTLEQAKPWLSHIAAVGLDSSELGHPPEKFARVFAAAAGLGLKRVAHAGEEGPPDYVRQALDLLHIDRLDHGNRSLEDAELVERLARDGMTLTVCPLSNHKLCVVDRLEDHPIDRMLAAGLRATINSDDPAYFGGYVADNYRAVAEARGLDRAALVQLARNSFTGSFLDPADVDRHLAAIDAYASAHA
ncbi:MULTISPECIES: adenosine deaminase [unclassified Sphingomonas]|jgi:adenosine deaminase|uniref:adenosine deaminase n=1 Tax=unclassified Sphingomonas TaxID=196159 RepID=UPI00082C282E|nr:MULTISPECIES: adenosine deaminase [unclassified Sphingomonas]MCH4891821.1 adenosine deaminase [Sphingomonas sp. SFZ2018-12]